MKNSTISKSAILRARFAAVSLCLGALLIVSWGMAAMAQNQEEENKGPNTSIERWAKGTYLYRGISDGRLRGTEDWTLTVHPDGSRTMRMWNDLYARNGHLTATLRVGQDFRPIEAHVSYWTQGQFKGSGLFTVSGDTLEAITNGPQGRIAQTIDVPQGFSIVTHPLAGDGWHIWYYDRAKGGEQTGAVYNIDSTPDLSKPAIGKLEPMALEYIADERIEVPAGTFEADHFRIGGNGDAWTTGPDSILVKFSWKEFDLEYVLDSYSTGDGHQR